MEPPSNAPTAPENTLSSTTEVKEEKHRGLEVDEITRIILRCAFKVHTAIGPGVFERVYHLCLLHELKKAGLFVESELTLPIAYDGLKIDAAYRVDLRVEKTVLVEIKAVESVAPIHHAQVLSYLQLSGLHVGLLLNFNVLHLVDGIRRFMR
jgi:GxxExxY protein